MNIMMPAFVSMSYGAYGMANAVSVRSIFDKHKKAENKIRFTYEKAFNLAWQGKVKKEFSKTNLSADKLSYLSVNKPKPGPILARSFVDFLSSSIIQATWCEHVNKQCLKEAEDAKAEQEPNLAKNQDDLSLQEGKDPRYTRRAFFKKASGAALFSTFALAGMGTAYDAAKINDAEAINNFVNDPQVMKLVVKAGNEDGLRAAEVYLKNNQSKTFETSQAGRKLAEKISQGEAGEEELKSSLSTAMVTKPLVRAGLATVMGHTINTVMPKHR